MSSLDMHGVVTYDDEGRRASARWTTTQSDGYVADVVVTYTYSPQGHTVAAVADHDSDGRADMYDSAAYDLDGRLTEHVFGAYGGGVWEQTTTRALTPTSAEPDAVREEVRETKSNDERVVIHYDARDRRLSRQRDSDGDGDVDSRTLYFYDDAGRRTHEDVQRRVDGPVEQRWSYRYDAQGRLSRELREALGSTCR